jgi:hypothetical protein
MGATVRAAKIGRSGAIIAAVIGVVGAIVVAMWTVDSGSDGGRTQTITGSVLNAPAINGDVNVNQPAVFERQARIDWQRQEDGRALGSVTIPVRPGGMWAGNAEVAFALKLGASCRRWWVEGFPPAMFNVRGGARENTDEVLLSTTTLPLAGRPVIFKLDCDRPVSVDGSWSPAAAG